MTASKLISFSVLILLVYALVNKASAFAIPAPMPLPKAISEARYVVVARVESVMPEPLGPNEGKSRSSIMAFATLLQPKSIYTMQVIKPLKQQINTPLTIALPGISSYYYGYGAFQIKPGSIVLLLLRLDNGGKLVPVDPVRPLILVKENMASISSLSNGDVQSHIVGFIIDSLSNPLLRQPNSFLLRDIVSPQVVIGLAPYVDDASAKVQDNVLYCLATNQQVAAIPRIVALDAKLAPNSGAEAVTALANFNTQEATPYLGPLLFSTSYYLRFNVMFALDHLAGHSSIPYLIMALSDPDQQKVIPLKAYVTLHKIVPSLGFAQGNDYFSQYQAAETRKLYAWWSDELLGKHLKPAEHLQLPRTIPNTPAQLNPMLFIPDTNTRRIIAFKLSQTGNASSIPYLVLALQDPDMEVAYTAYKTLHRLIPSLGAAEGSDSFAANHAAATQLVYDWWRDELLGKHSPK